MALCDQLEQQTEASISAQSGLVRYGASRYDALDELARTGGVRATDSLEFFACPEPTKDHNYEVYFFGRGLRHLHPENQQRAAELKPNERLYVMSDPKMNSIVWHY